MLERVWQPAGLSCPANRARNFECGSMPVRGASILGAKKLLLGAKKLLLGGKKLILDGKKLLLDAKKLLLDGKKLLLGEKKLILDEKKLLLGGKKLILDEKKLLLDANLADRLGIARLLCTRKPLYNNELRCMSLLRVFDVTGQCLVPSTGPGRGPRWGPYYGIREGPDFLSGDFV